MNIDISDSENKADLVIAIIVVLFFGGLSWYLFGSSFAAPTATSTSIISVEDENTSTILLEEEEEKEREEEKEKDTNSPSQVTEASEEQNEEENEEENIITPVVLDDTEKRILSEAVKNVEFKEGTAELMRSSRPSLYRIAKIMKKHPDFQLRIIAYTEASTKELAKSRAEACFNYLIGEEIEPKRISYKGKGYKATLNTDDIKKDNSDRVEFKLSY